MSKIETSGVGSMEESQILELKLAWHNEYLIWICEFTNEQRYWKLKLGELRLDFVFVRTVSESYSSAGNPAKKVVGTELVRPESWLESLEARAIRQLAEAPTLESFFSRCLGRGRDSGQLNKVIHTHLADGSIGDTMPQNPRSRFQRYRLTDGEQATIEEMSDRNANT
jgi:hypothetical protein